LLPTLIVALPLAACDSGHPQGTAAAPANAATANSAAASPVSSGAVAPAINPPIPSALTAAPSTAPAAKSNDIDWHGSLDWHSYQQGVELAKQSHKPILLMIYADWCSKCRALVPVFERSDVRELASRMVAVRQDQDEPAPWLSEIGGADHYVPRIMFLSSDGLPLKEVTSGHPRYPFFYVADRPEILLNSLKRALNI
jgi:protein-disulfide reductase (glutathione)